MLKKWLAADAMFRIGLALIRVVTGISVARYGLEIFHPDQMKGNVDWLTDVHFPLPRIMAYVGKLAELVGGLFLMLGFFTRFAAVFLVFTMTVVIIFMNRGDIFGDGQLPFLFVLLFASFFFMGGGWYSLDRLFFGGGKEGRL